MRGSVTGSSLRGASAEFGLSQKVRTQEGERLRMEVGLSVGPSFLDGPSGCLGLYLLDGIVPAQPFGSGLLLFG